MLAGRRGYRRRPLHPGPSAGAGPGAGHRPLRRMGGRLHGRIASDPDGQPAGEGVPGLDAREPAASYPDLGNVSRRADPFEPPYAISDGLDLNADPASATPRRAGPSGMLIGPRDVPHGTADASRALRIRPRLVRRSGLVARVPVAGRSTALLNSRQRPPDPPATTTDGAPALCCCAYPCTLRTPALVGSP